MMQQVQGLADQLSCYEDDNNTAAGAGGDGEDGACDTLQMRANVVGHFKKRSPMCPPPHPSPTLIVLFDKPQILEVTC